MGISLSVRLFPIFRRTTPGGGGKAPVDLDFVLHQKPGVRQNTLLQSVLSSVRSAVNLSYTRFLFRRDCTNGVLLTDSYLGSGAISNTPGIGISQGLKSQDVNTPATNLVQIKYDLVRTKGANSVSQTAVNGRSDWTNVANASGETNSAVATIQNTVGGDRSGRLELLYLDATDKTLLAIQQVQIKYVVRQTNTLLGNGGLWCEYRFNPSTTWLNFGQLTGEVTTNQVHDITSIIGGDWAKLNTLECAVRAQLPSALNTITATCDAVEVIVTATLTESL